MAFWFTISFITNILGPLIPDIIHNFNLSDLAMAGMEAGLPLPPWILLAAVAVMLGDAIASTVLRPVKRFLVSSGARFGRPKPFGRLPRGLAE